MENDNLQRVGDVVISNNEDGNKRHNASDGKFAKKETGDGSVAKELSDTALGITQSKVTPVYQELINNKIPFEKWPENAKNHFIDDKISMEYFEKVFIPKIMEEKGYIAYRNLSGTEYDNKGVDYVFLDEEGGLRFVDLKNINASFNSKSFITDNITLRVMQTVTDKTTGDLKIVDGYLLNKRHLDQDIYVQMLNAGMDADLVGKTLLSGRVPKILKHSFFTVDSNELRNVIFGNFNGEENLRKTIKDNIELLMSEDKFYKSAGYEAIENSDGKPIHIVVPIPKIGPIVTGGAHFAYDIKYKKGKPARYTCTLIMSKNVASSDKIFKKNKNYTPLFTNQQK